MKILLLILIFNITSLFAISSYEKFKLANQKTKVSQEIIDYRKLMIETIDIRKTALGNITNEQKEKIEKIKECVNKKIIKKEINNCVPSLLKPF